MEYSNFVNYSTDMCRSCPCTYYVPIYRQVSSLLCTLLGLGFLPQFPRGPCGRSVRKIASTGRVVHFVVPYCASFCPARLRHFCGLGIGFVFLLFLSVWFRQLSVKPGALGFCYGRGDCFSWCLGGFD